MTDYKPPTVWSMAEVEGQSMGFSLNRPDAGARTEKELPKGQHPLQLYSLGTPNGQKVTILLEELLLLGVKGAEYDAYLVNIGTGEQFTSGFVDVNPNSKIPGLMDYSMNPPQRVFESSSVLVYLAEKFGHFLPKEAGKKAEAMSWLFWGHGSAPIVGGGFGHFFNYAPTKQKYPLDRFTMETKRLMDVLDKRLANNKYLAGDEYTIADIGCYTWYGGLVLDKLYKNSAEFLDAKSYKHLNRWANEISQREGVKRGSLVNKEDVKERHSAADIDAALAKK